MAFHLNEIDQSLQLVMSHVLGVQLTDSINSILYYVLRSCTCEIDRIKTYVKCTHSWRLKSFDSLQQRRILEIDITTEKPEATSVETNEESINDNKVILQFV